MQREILRPNRERHLVKAKSEIGKKYNHLTILDVYPVQNGKVKQYFAKVHCDICNTHKDVILYKVTKEHIKQCGCSNGLISSAKKRRYKNFVLGDSKYNDLPRIYVAVYSPEQLAHLDRQWDIQNSKCFYTDMPISLSNKIVFNNREIREAAIDHIVPKDNSSPTNLVWVHPFVNWLKGSFSLDEFEKMIDILYNSKELRLRNVQNISDS